MTNSQVLRSQHPRGQRRSNLHKLEAGLNLLLHDDYSSCSGSKDISRTADVYHDPAEQERVTDAYVCRLFPLTCLAPDIVEAILDGQQPRRLRLAEMLGNELLGWDEQCCLIGRLRQSA